MGKVREGRGRRREAMESEGWEGGKGEREREKGREKGKGKKGWKRFTIN